MAVLFALLFAVTLWATIPVGYMTDVSEEGFKVVLCDSQGPVHTLTIGADGQPVDDQTTSTDDGPCTLGRSHGDTPLEEPVLPVTLIRPSYGAAVDHPEPPAPLHGDVQGFPPPARAPPILI